MILVDTSVWIDHLRQHDEELSAMLLRGRVLTHPFVIGELALGNIKNRAGILGPLRDLPHCQMASDLEVFRFIESEALFGQGIGYVDAHLLAAVRLTPGSALWTRDKRLLTVASGLGLLSNAVH